MFEFANIVDLSVPAGLGALAGVLSMLLYGRWSPQERLQELKTQSSELQQQMSDFDGDFAGAITLAKQNLGLSFKRLGLALGPSLLSGIPVLAALPLIGEAYITYFASVAVAAIIVKQWRKIS